MGILYGALTLASVQLSHTRKGEPLGGEPVEIQVPLSLTQLGKIVTECRERCGSDAECNQACINAARENTETRTTTPEHYSYVKWADVMGELGEKLEDTTLAIPVPDKSVTGAVSDTVKTILSGGLTVVYNIDRARCRINLIRAEPGGRSLTVEDGVFAAGIPLNSGYAPTLDCEGRAVGGFGLIKYGWADGQFPDIALANMYLTVRLGPWELTDDGLPRTRFGGVEAEVKVDIDAIGIPDFGEDVVDWFTDYRHDVEKAVGEAIVKVLEKRAARAGLGQGLLEFVKFRTGDPVEKFCRVSSRSKAIEFEYEIDDEDALAELLPDPTCERGIRRGSACCAASCGTCGGTGCSQREGGADACCRGHIVSGSRSCAEFPPPCQLPEPEMRRINSAH